MARIAVIGPGAIGGTVAAWLMQSGRHEVTVCARTGFETLVVTTPEGVLTARPRVLVDAAAAVAADWVLVTTKAYDVAAAGAWLERLVGPETRVAVLQNGVEHVARFAGLVPERRIVPAVVDIPASRSGPGQITQHRLGTIVVPEGADGAAFVTLFESTGIAVSAVPNWAERAWSKLCLNCAGAVTALTMRATGPVWSDEIEALVEGLARECAAVARAEGVTIDESVIAGVVEGARRAPEGSGNSMYADRLAGRPMELDARNGVIVRLGERHGVPTPLNRLFVTLLAASGSPWMS
jgi:2-dehydropantoate 2-reductase